MKKSYHHGDLKTQLMREGLLILNSEGYEGLTMRKVAQACGVSQTAPYRHFKDKDELVLAIVSSALSAFNESLESAVDTNQDPTMQLKMLGIAYIRFFAHNPEYLWLLFINDKQKPKEDFCSKEKHLKIGHPFATFQQVVERYQIAREDEQRSLDELMLYCWGLVHGISALLASGQLPFGEDGLAIAERIILSEKFL